MKFTGQFKSLHNEDLYTVTIDCSNAGTSTRDVSLGPEPFVTNMDGGSNTIYVPVKYQSATVQLVANNSSSAFFNLYSSTPKQNKVELVKDNTVMWTGYTSPNIYDTPYNFVTETWEVECIDKLSVLKYYDYTPIDGSLGFVSFTQIINHCLTQAGYDNTSKWYFSNATHVPDKSFLTDRLYVSEANFFDEDDKPMKMNEVLEEVCKFCGVTAVAYGKDVYFLDYDALKNASSTYKRYFRHTVGSNTAVTSATQDCSIYATFDVSAGSYTMTGTNLSLDNVYSKVTVKDSLYTVDSIIPSLFEDEDLQNVKYVNEDNQNWNYEFEQRSFDFGDLRSTYDPNHGPADWWDALGTSVKKAAEDDTYFWMKSRYYTNKRYEHPVYDNSGNGPSLFPLIDSSVMDATNRQGILCTKWKIASGKTREEANNNMGGQDFENYLMLTVNRTASLNSLNKPKLISKPEFTKPFFMSGKAHILATGSLILTDRYMFPRWNLFGPADEHGLDAHPDTSVGYFPDAGTYKGDYYGWTAFWTDFSKVLYVPKDKLRLKVSVGINGTDISTNIPFFPLDTENQELREDGGADPHHEVFYQKFDIQNTVDYRDNISDKGYDISTGLAADEVVLAKPIIKIYGADSLIQHFGTKNPLACVFIKDFDIQAVVGYQGGKNENDTDTEYSYVIDDQYVQELSPIEFKICTYDNKQLTYSAVAWLDPSTNKYQFVDTLRNRALNQIQRSEHLLCYRIVNQYKDPSMKLSINLFMDNIRPWSIIHEPLLDKDFIIDTVSYDYKNDTATCNLVQKK